MSLAIDFSVENCPSFYAHDAQALTCTGRAPLAVRFVPLATATVTQYIWNFGDAPTFNSELSPNHVYTTPGVYTATLVNMGEPFSGPQKVPVAGPGSSGSGAGSVLLFSNSSGVSCLGLVTSITGTLSSPASITVSLLDRDFANLSVASDMIPGCPASGMNVYRLGKRTRYMVCGPPGGSPNQFALYRQTAGTNGTWNPAAMWQDGIEDLQVSGRYLDQPVNAFAAYGSGGTSCANLGGAVRVCNCDDDPASTTCATATMPPGGCHCEATGPSLTTDPIRTTSFDHAAMGTPDNFVRIQQGFAVSFENLQVTP